MPTPRNQPSARAAAAPQPVPPAALTEQDIDTLQGLLDSLPAPLEPLDVVMLDGFLCGVLLQPHALPATAWLPLVCDVERRPPPARFDRAGLDALVLRRHAELAQAIAARRWFDPWVFELDEAADPSEVVMPWVAGFSLAVNELPALPALDSAAAIEPLAALYRHLDPDDLEDADALLEEIDQLEPPAELAEAVEDLVRATLLLADLTRPLAPARPHPRRPTPRSGAPRAAQRPGAKRPPRR
ncbi:MAG: YecA family protein [Aquabacterium sp.]